MDPRTQERVEEWDTRPFNGGYDGLSDLADADFSGAVSAAGTWLFMLNGRIVGVVDGAIEDFERASGTRYEAPHPSLPLLCAMEERGGETRAQYYTNETPLREVDSTLQSGSFTGYVELSENVLSGDYYAVYYGGRRMAAAYIGNAERLLTGDEAFERAADEVGIYEVTDVDIEVIDVPGTTGNASAPETADGSDSSPDSGSATEAGASDPAVSERTEPGSDREADATSPSIDPIDVSDTDPVGADDSGGSDPIEDITVDDSALTSDIDLTDDPAGITSTEETETEPEPSTGITDAERSATPDPESGPESRDSDDGTESREGNAVEQAERSGGDGSSTPTIETASEPTDPTTDDSPTAGSTEETAAVTDAEPEIDDESEQSPPSNTGSAGVGASGSDESEQTATFETGPDPDLAEVEAAAEELDRNDISWVEEEEGDEADPTGSPGDEPVTVSGGDATAADEEGDLEEQFEREEAWRETRRIPSIDPDDSEADESTTADARSRDASGNRPSPTSDAGSGPADSTSSTRTQTDSRSGEQTGASSSAGTPSETREDRSQEGSRRRGSDQTQAADSTDERGRKRVAALTEKVETLTEQRDALVAKAEELEAERDRLRSENDDLSSTVERLRSRIEELETELKRERGRDGDTGTTTAGAGTSPSTQLSPEQALSGTNLFVRYASKSQPTLETAHDGNADRSEVASNLRLEHHTQFDSDDAAVDGVPYEEFLASTMEHRFVDWLTEMVLYEIRDTGNADGLADLYDAIPRIDRAELGATISLADDDTEDVPDQVTFDVVAFDKMGNPLVIATLNDSREPATKELLAELEEAASAVKANYPDLAAAIAVTSSYFEPGALEVAEQATSGGFLSRGSRLSYVNLSRKEGYHLCLVESRSEGFHMSVPEL